VACCTQWVESEGAAPSGTTVAMLMSRFLGISRLRSRASFIRALAAVAPKRTAGSLQLESFFVAPEFRGAGLAAALTSYCISETTARSTTTHAEISLLAENTAAARAYRSAGFESFWHTPANDPLFAERTGSAGFVQLRRTIQTLTPNTEASGDQ